MPSWNEKAHVIPTINVNRLPCNSPCEHYTPRPASGHGENCSAKPVPVPCPIPRSVTFTVRPGGCECVINGPFRPLGYQHGPECPARPIKVVCYISGGTWEESEVAETEHAPVDDVPHGADSWAPLRIADACRARWALVKRVVLGVPEAEAYMKWPVGLTLYAQRDAVFSALAEQARLEEAMLAAQERTVKAIASPRLTTGPSDLEQRPSAQAMTVFVERLIEQVGVMP
jgi:hypothetical protein